MNIIWSRYVQSTETLFYSRKLRFDDMFAEQYKALFDLKEKGNLKILEIGCGPGALAGALHRWYPKAEVTAVDRDSEFLRFAREHEKGIEFIEGDATDLPFADNTFDVTISNTVSEHIEPAKFYGEQHRVLKPGGVCLVLSSRKGIHLSPDWFTVSEYERLFWEKAERYDDTMEKYSVCKYPMSEAQLPAALPTPPSGPYKIRLPSLFDPFWSWRFQNSSAENPETLPCLLRALSLYMPFPQTNKHRSVFLLHVFQNHPPGHGCAIKGKHLSGIYSYLIPPEIICLQPFRV